MEGNKEIIKEVATQTLASLGVKHDEMAIMPSVFNSHIRLSIKTPDSAILIGLHGETLSALNHIIRKIAGKKQLDIEDSFFVDINDYQENSLKNLRNKITILAERARSFKTSIELDPMSPYERMLVHSHLSEDKELVTESQGEGKNRRVVIKYKKSF